MNKTDMIMMEIDQECKCNRHIDLKKAIELTARKLKEDLEKGAFVDKEAFCQAWLLDYNKVFAEYGIEMPEVNKKENK